MNIATHKNRIKGILHFILSHKKLSIVVGVILVALTVIFFPKPPPPLETVTVKLGPISQSVSASGTIDSASSVNLNFVTAGKLVYLGAKKGDQVTQGQLIAQLDQRTTQKNLEATLKDYAKERNSFEQTKDDKGVEKIADASTDTIKRILEDSQYDLEKAVLSVELQNLAKESSLLTSPIAGTLIRSDVSVPGVNVSVATTFTVADTDNLLFKIDIDESDIGKVRIGQPVTLFLDAYPEETVSLTVSKIDFASHTTSTGGNVYTVEAEMPVSADDRYRIGMSGDAEVLLAQKPRVLTVPLSSIVDETYVYVKGEKEFEKKKVSLGLQNDTDIEVRSGIKEGDIVAISPPDVEKRQNIKRPSS